MPVEIRGNLSFLRDHMEEIMIILGTFLIFASVPLMTRLYQWVSALSFLSGVAIAIIGIALHFESFKWKVPSIEGFGSILIYVSFMFLAVAVVAAVFTVPRGVVSTPAYGSSSWLDEHGSPFAWISKSPENSFLTLVLERPITWLATPLMLTGLGLLAFGCLLKFAKDIF